jgi:hypothetical protein
LTYNPPNHDVTSERAIYRRRPTRRNAIGGWSNSVRSAASRSLVGFASMDRSESAVKAGGESSEPGCSIFAPVVSWVNGELTGASGEASGVISRGRFRFWAIDWVTKVVSARGRPGSTGFEGLWPDVERPRDPLRVKPARPLAAAAADDAPPVPGRAARESDSRITIPSSGPSPRPAGVRVGGEPSFHRAGALRSSDVAGNRSAFTVARDAAIDPPGFIGRPGRGAAGP